MMWKESRVVLVHKGGTKKEVRNYIPIVIINHIKRRKAYTTYRNHTSRQRQFKTGVPQGGVFHPHYLTFTPQTYHHPVHRFRLRPTQMTSPSHAHTQARVQPINIQPYLHKVFGNLIYVSTRMANF